jgi:hypothetical protein
LRLRSDSGLSSCDELASRPADQEPAKLDLKKIRSVRPREYLIRFAFGASISAVAGALTLAAGPRFGGLFLASLRSLGADVGFAITGLEGTPDNGQPRGLTYLAVATPDDRTLLRRHTHDHGAGRNRERDVRTSLQLIQSSLDGEPTR